MLALALRPAAQTRTPPVAPKFVGDQACLECHQAESLSYRLTAHHNTSQLPSATSILGSFAPGSNLLVISDPDKSSGEPRLSFRMDATPTGFYETAVAELNGKTLTHTERIGLVLGSGVRGQTYLFWKANALFELPVSYWTDGHRWINSPGYRDGTANFGRHVDPRCLECHASYLQTLSADPQTNLYDPSTLTPGIGCESCHGPGAAHIAQHLRPNPSAKQPSAILNPAHFPRDRQIDQCALCHNGTQREPITPAFSYSPGEDLSHHLAPNPLDAAPSPDVHGNQVGLLERSRCFLSSPSMTCSTCHEVHAPERAATDYSPKCLNCHQWQSCGASKRIGPSIVRDCIRCHMPLQQTSAIISETAGSIIHTSVRTHWIKVYPEANEAAPHR